jgi:hypothetical protein
MIIIQIQLLHAKRVSMDIAMVETNAQMENTDDQQYYHHIK